MPFWPVNQNDMHAHDRIKFTMRAQARLPEYLAPAIAIKVVAGLDEAIVHINHYGSHHTDGILTRDHMHTHRFLRRSIRPA